VQTKAFASANVHPSRRTQALRWQQFPNRSVSNDRNEESIRDRREPARSNQPPAATDHRARDAHSNTVWAQATRLLRSHRKRPGSGLDRKGHFTRRITALRQHTL